MTADDPAAVEHTAELLAARAAAYAPGAVASWDTVEDVLLAHSVARRLGVRRLTVAADLGRVTVQPAPPDVVVLVGAALDRERAIVPAEAVLSGHGSRLAAAISADDL